MKTLQDAAADNSMRAQPHSIGKTKKPARYLCGNKCFHIRQPCKYKRSQKGCGSTVAPYAGVKVADVAAHAVFAYRTRPEALVARRRPLCLENLLRDRSRVEAMVSRTGCPQGVGVKSAPCPRGTLRCSCSVLSLRLWGRRPCGCGLLSRWLWVRSGGRRCALYATGSSYARSAPRCLLVAQNCSSLCSENCVGRPCGFSKTYCLSHSRHET